MKLAILVKLAVFGEELSGNHRRGWLENQETAEYWLRDGTLALKKALNRKLNQNRAKNVVLLMGDGMGIQSLTTGRILRGQKQGKSGEDYRTAMEQFDNVGLSKTYNIDFQIPDSAATATARASNEF